MAVVGNTPRPAYVYDTETDTWVPVGVGAHTHSDIPNTLVDAKGDLITATADNVPARLAKGADGTVLVSDSSTSTGLAWQPYGAIQVAGKNKIINGDFGVWQRGSTSATAGGWNFFPDRWQTYNYGGTYSPSRQTFTPGAAPVAGYEGQYFLRINSTSTFSTMATTIEDVRTLAGQTATLSFWAKSNTAGPLKITFAQGFGSGGSAAVDIVTQQTTIGTLSTSWQRYTFTTSIPSVSGKTIGAGSLLFLQIFADVSKDLDVWGVQLEAGPIATPFTTATGTIQGELAACQRYYYRHAAGIAYTPIANGFMQDANNGMCLVTPPVPMRTVPHSLEYSSLQIIDSSYTASGGTPAFGISESSNYPIRVYWISATGQTANRPAVLRAANSTSAYIGFSAEL